MKAPYKLFFMLIGIFLTILLLFFPRIFGNYLTHLMIVIFVFGFVSSCWNILSGFTGPISVGHALFFGTGAYTAASLNIYFQINPWLGMILGAILAGLIGCGIGALTFRFGLIGHSFALATIALSNASMIIVINVLTLGGASGLSLSLTKLGWIQFQFLEKAPYYYIILIMLTGLLLFKYFLIKSKLGYFFISIRENEKVSQSLGINPFYYKVLSISLSAFLTALAGGFYAQYLKFVDPFDVLGLSFSIEIMLFAIVGGLGTVFGPIIGTFAMVSLGEVTRLYIGAESSGAHVIIYGIILIIVIIYAPRGIMGFLESLNFSFLKTKIKTETVTYNKI